jgi:hypothetical protein
LNAEAHGKLRLRFGINFKDERPAGHVARNRCNFRGSRAARLAPGCPEVD